MGRIHPDDRDTALGVIRNMLAHKRDINIDMRVIPSDGRTRWLNLSAKAVEDGGDFRYYAVYTDVTDRRRIEEELRVIGEEYRIAVSQSGRLMMRYSAPERSLSYGAGGTSVYGTDVADGPEAFVDAGRVAPESAEAWLKLFSEIDVGKQSGSAQVRCISPDGEFRWYEAVFTAIKSAGGDTVSAIISFEDITDRRESDRHRAIERESLLLALCSQYPLVIVCNLTKNSYYMRNYSGFTTHTADDSGEFDRLIVSGAESVPETDRAGFIAAFSRESLLEAFSRGEQSVKLEHRQIGDDGLIHWIETTVMRVPNEFDSDVLEVTVARRIDDRKAAEQKLRDSLENTTEELEENRHYGELVDKIGPGLAIVYYPGRNEAPYMNGNLTDRIGYTREEVRLFLTHGVAETEFKEMLEEVRQDFKRELESKPEYINKEYRIIRPDATAVWVTLDAVRFTESGGELGYVMAITETTERHELMERLRVNEEETSLTMARLGKPVLRYDVAAQRLIVPKNYAHLHNLPEICENVRENIGKYNTNFADEGGRDRISAMLDDIHNGEKTGETEVKYVLRTGEFGYERSEYITVFGYDGKPARAIIVIEDTTELHEREAENRRLRENERIMRAVAEHSERIVYYYDVVKREAAALDRELAGAAGLPPIYDNPPRCMIENGSVLPDSIENIVTFFNDISAGVPKGEEKIHISCKDGHIRWFDFRYTSVSGDDGKTSGAVLSFLDITSRHELELSYARYLRSIDSYTDGDSAYFESDLTEDVVEREGGLLLGKESVAGMSFGAVIELFAKKYLDESAGEEFAQYYSRERMLSLAASGIKSDQREQRISNLKNDDNYWIDISLQFISDPYTGHARVLTLFHDVTGSKKAQLETQRRADIDGLTGIYNRSMTERQITAKLSGGAGSFVFALLDIDDFKGINDSCGHKEGDRVLIDVADALKTAAKKLIQNDAVAGRVGGDEFVLFMHGDSGSAETCADIESVAASLSAICANDRDRHVRCSIGCAQGRGGIDSFDELYMRADTALYNVKNNGKNGFAFYRSDMRLPGSAPRQNGNKNGNKN